MARLLLGKEEGGLRDGEEKGREGKGREGEGREDFNLFRHVGCCFVIIFQNHIFLIVSEQSQACKKLETPLCRGTNIFAHCICTIAASCLKDEKAKIGIVVVASRWSLSSVGSSPSSTFNEAVPAPEQPGRLFSRTVDDL